MLAASTASAPPMRIPSERWSSAPTPPEAITGTSTASLIARVSSRSKPLRVPSRSMLVSRISPAPLLGHAARPLHGVEAGVAAAAVRVDIPAGQALGTLGAGGAPLGIDGDDDALRAVLRRGLADHLGIGDCGGVEADLVGAGIEQAAHVLDGAHAAADRQRNEDLRGDRFDDVQDQVAPVAGCGDVEEGEFVGALLVVARGDLDRIAGVAQLDEVDALDHAAAGDVETGNDAFGKHAGLTGKADGLYPLVSGPPASQAPTGRFPRSVAE